MATFKIGPYDLMNDTSGLKFADGRSIVAPNSGVEGWGEANMYLKNGINDVLVPELRPYAKEIEGWNDKIAATENYDTGFGAGKWVPGTILGLAAGGLWNEFGGSSFLKDLFGGDASWGVNPQGAGMDLTDILEEAGNFTTGADPSGFMMPPAIPETPAQLAEWGLKETSPGFWEMPAIPGSGSSATDWLKKIASDPGTWGKIAASGLGVYGANKQASSLTELANKYSEYGAPSRARFEASMTPGFDPNSIPGYSGALDTASKSILARLSATGGNPWGNPGGLIEANKQIIAGTALPAISEYQRLNLAGGGLASLNSSIPGLQTGAIGKEGDALTALGYGLNAVTSPTPSLADLYKSFQLHGLA